MTRKWRRNDVERLWDGVGVNIGVMATVNVIIGVNIGRRRRNNRRLGVVGGMLGDGLGVVNERLGVADKRLGVVNRRLHVTRIFGVDDIVRRKAARQR